MSKNNGSIMRDAKTVLDAMYEDEFTSRLFCDRWISVLGPKYCPCTTAAGTLLRKLGCRVAGGSRNHGLLYRKTSN